jgi:hypothetical protein
MVVGEHIQLAARDFFDGQAARLGDLQDLGELTFWFDAFCYKQPESLPPFGA